MHERNNKKKNLTNPFHVRSHAVAEVGRTAGQANGRKGEREPLQQSRSETEFAADREIGPKGHELRRRRQSADKIQREGNRFVLQTEYGKLIGTVRAAAAVLFSSTQLASRSNWHCFAVVGILADEWMSEWMNRLSCCYQEMKKMMILCLWFRQHKIPETDCK